MPCPGLANEAQCPPDLQPGAGSRVRLENCRGGGSNALSHSAGLSRQQHAAPRRPVPLAVIMQQGWPHAREKHTRANPATAFTGPGDGRVLRCVLWCAEDGGSSLIVMSCTPRGSGFALEPGPTGASGSLMAWSPGQAGAEHRQGTIPASWACRR